MLKPVDSSSKLIHCLLGWGHLCLYTCGGERDGENVGLVPAEQHGVSSFLGRAGASLLRSGASSARGALAALDVQVDICIGERVDVARSGSAELGPGAWRANRLVRSS